MTKRKPYKEPVFLFTSCSLRFAAWAGWHSAFGDKKKTEQWCHQAHSEWIKELASGRRLSFAGRYNYDLYEYIEPKVLATLINTFFRDVNREIKKGKAVKSDKIVLMKRDI
ncbi:MAG: hypothetical protein ABH856_01925 [Patescibacteria group bacterium]